MIRKTLGFNDLYQYHIDKYKDLIKQRKEQIKEQEETVSYYRELLINNVQKISEVMDFDMNAHIENDKCISTRHRCETNIVYQNKRFARMKFRYKNNTEVHSYLFYIHRVILEFYNSRLQTFKYNDELKLYESYIIDKDEFKTLYNLWQVKVQQLLLEGNDIILPNELGTIGFYRIVNNYGENTRANTYIQWGETNKLKKIILNNGGTLYNKADHQAAIERGEEYNGKKYLVYKSDTFSYSFQWYGCKNMNAKLYEFVLPVVNHSAYYNNGTFYSVDDYYEFLKDKQPSTMDIVALPIGIKSKLLLLCRIYPHWVIKYVKDIKHNKFLQEHNNKYMAKELSEKPQWYLDKYAK